MSAPYHIALYIISRLEILRGSWDAKTGSSFVDLSLCAKAHELYILALALDLKKLQPDEWKKVEDLYQAFV